MIEEREYRWRLNPALGAFAWWVKIEMPERRYGDSIYWESPRDFEMLVIGPQARAAKVADRIGRRYARKRERQRNRTLAKRSRVLTSDQWYSG